MGMASTSGTSRTKRCTGEYHVPGRAGGRSPQPLEFSYGTFAATWFQHLYWLLPTGILRLMLLPQLIDISYKALTSRAGLGGIFQPARHIPSIVTFLGGCMLVVSGPKGSSSGSDTFVL